MKLSARNQFPGKVVAVKEGVVTALVVVDIGDGKKITSTISMDALKDLNIKVGSQVTSIIKASAVILAAD
ncbi:MAG TPA: TOBE domain-containing protein [Syntrophomonadaceae bacterium]|nr:TOBE domain-containing protein [Syntrophomonadaceae bacterium]